MNQIEETLFHLVNSLSGRYAFLDGVMFWLSDSSTWILAGSAFYIYAYAAKKKDLIILFWCAIICVAFSDLISFELIKPLVGRERPCWILSKSILMDGKCGGSYGFTSNHAANSFAVWAAVVKKNGIQSKMAKVCLALALLISMSRVYLGVHFVGDVVGGALLGAAVSSVLWSQGLDSWATIISNRTGAKRLN